MTMRMIFGEFSFSLRLSDRVVLFLLNILALTAHYPGVIQVQYIQTPIVLVKHLEQHTQNRIRKRDKP